MEIYGLDFKLFGYDMQPLLDLIEVRKLNESTHVANSEGQVDNYTIIDPVVEHKEVGFEIENKLKPSNYSKELEPNNALDTENKPGEDELEQATITQPADDRDEAQAPSLIRLEPPEELVENRNEDGAATESLTEPAVDLTTTYAVEVVTTTEFSELEFGSQDTTANLQDVETNK